MAHLAIIVPEESGHFHPMASLGRELVRRGHRATVFGTLDGRRQSLAAGFEFTAIGERRFPVGSRERFAELLGRLSGRAGTAATVREGVARGRMMLDELPDALSSSRIDLLLADQIYFCGRSVAERVGIGLVTVCDALMFNGEPGVPPPIFGHDYSPAWWARLRNRLLWAGLRYYGRPLLDMLNERRRDWKLPPHRDFLDAESQTLVLSQTPAAFEFPRERLPASYRLVGPLIDPTARPPVDFPYDRLNGRPLVYASLGTLQTRLRHVYQTIAEACVGVDAQLVLACGGAIDDLGSNLPEDIIAVPYAPQLELLDRAALVVTHAGLNTTLESLMRGLPMVALPITNDQPGVAARIVHHGVGLRIPLDRLSVERLRAAVRRGLADETLRTAARRMQVAIGPAGGLQAAADAVERQLG